MPLVTEIVTDPLRFAALADDWDALAATQEGDLTLHAWYNAAFAAQNPQRCRLQVVAVWDGDLLVAAAPLMCDTSMSPARLIPIDAFAGELDRLLYDSPDALAALVQAVASLMRPVLFRRLVANEDEMAMLASALRSHALVHCKPRHTSAAISLPPDFSLFEAGMSSNRRSTLGRKWRGAKREHGAIRAEFIKPVPGEIPAELARIAVVEGSGWKGRSGTALAADRRMGDFVGRAAQAFVEAGNLVLAFLKIGDHDAACRLILRQGSTWFEIKIGYDEQFAKFSPGVLLMHETLREACRRGIASYAFLGLRESWQDHWPHAVIQDYRLATYPLSASGGLAMVADGAQALASFARRLRR